MIAAVPDAEKPSATDLARAILRDSPLFGADEMAERAGATPTEARRLWRALGFPEPDGEDVYSQADADSLAAVMSVVGHGLVDFDTVLNLARAVGQTMARLADWQVAALTTTVERLESGNEATGSLRGSALRLVDDIGEPFSRLMVYTWRRHLAAAVARVEAVGGREEDLHTVQVTVGFADIVSFTALSNDLAQRRIGDLVEVFESRCADVVAAHRGRVIKSIGDSVLFVNADPIAAVETAWGIIAVIGRDARMPDVRLGLATGSVVTRLGDVFGPPVNLAARLTAVARRNRVIIDAATAEMLPPEEYQTRRLPARPVHGFGLVEPLTVRRQ